jgi:heme/copper-type cytochrome/quinol oxidase subunit 2
MNNLRDLFESLWLIVAIVFGLIVLLIYDLWKEKRNNLKL